MRMITELEKKGTRKELLRECAGEELAVTISLSLSSWVLTLVTSPSSLCSQAQSQVQLLTSGMSGEATVPTSRSDP